MLKIYSLQTPEPVLFSNSKVMETDTTNIFKNLGYWRVKVITKQWNKYLTHNSNDNMRWLNNRNKIKKLN